MTGTCFFGVFESNDTSVMPRSRLPACSQVHVTAPCGALTDQSSGRSTQPCNAGSSHVETRPAGIDARRPGRWRSGWVGGVLPERCSRLFGACRAWAGCAVLTLAVAAVGCRQDPDADVRARAESVGSSDSSLDGVSAGELADTIAVVAEASGSNGTLEVAPIDIAACDTPSGNSKYQFEHPTLEYCAPHCGPQVFACPWFGEIIAFGSKNPGPGSTPYAENSIALRLLTCAAAPASILSWSFDAGAVKAAARWELRKAPSVPVVLPPLTAENCPPQDGKQPTFEFGLSGQVVYPVKPPEATLTVSTDDANHPILTVVFRFAFSG